MISVATKNAWPTTLLSIWASLFEVERKVLFPLCPAGIAKFDPLWCKISELRNFELLHHFNAHHVYQILKVGDKWNILKCTMH
jgi:hypothetical protein